MEFLERKQKKKQTGRLREFLLFILKLDFTAKSCKHSEK